MKHTLSIILAALTLLSRLGAAHAQGANADTVWIEGEAPSAVSPADLKPEITGDGQPDYLSGGNWLQVSVEAGDVGTKVPEGGIVLSYKFAAPKAASYELWDRIGFEAARSAFDWRVDGGAWATVTPDARTTDVMQLQTWNPVAWLKLGTPSLAAGDHTLDVRLSRTKDDKDPSKYKPVLYACDAFCLTDIPFRPNGPSEPGDLSWQTDADRAAAAQAFSVPEEAPPAPNNGGASGDVREIVSLAGNWQIARDDEGTVSDPSGPIKAVPDAGSLFWKSMPVPGDRDKARPEWMYAHRYWLRTRIDVPADMAGRSFHLHFPAVSLIATVFVNGQSCGFTKAPFADWDCDITQAVKPGQSNELWVGIKDWFYALPSQGAKDGDTLRYIPTDWVAKYGPADYTFPVWNHTENGILRTPTLIVAGPAYTSDVFAIPSVKNKTLGLDVTVHNPGTQPLTVQVENTIEPLGGPLTPNNGGIGENLSSSGSPLSGRGGLPSGSPIIGGGGGLLRGGPAAKTFAPKSLTVPAGQDALLNLTEAWPDPKLWWPDDPNQYNVVTRLTSGGKTLDEVRTKFGFREWIWTGPDFALNGVPWHGRADTSDLGPLGDGWLQKYHRHGQTMIRVWGESPDMEQDLDWYDAHGVCLRRTGIFDGEAARYTLTEDGKPRPELFDNWKTQLLAWVRTQRNHPSIFLWSIENEIAFINAHVYGNDAIIDPAERTVAQAVLALDPTRPLMTDGGNALLDESLPVYGGHYMAPPFQTLPEGAYDKAAFAHRQVWPVTQPKPILLGEDFYANGNEPSDFATVGGESAFVGKAEAAPSLGLTARMLSEGYRWSGISFHFWEGNVSDAYYNAWQPVAVLCRQWDWTFASGQKVPRTLGLFNDTRFPDPITLTWTLTLGGRRIASNSSVHHVAPGTNEKFTVTLPLPTVKVRQEGQWALTLTRGGKPIFHDVKAISVLGPHPALIGHPSPFGKGEGPGAVRRSGFAHGRNQYGFAPRNAKIAMSGSHQPLSLSEGGGVPDEGGVGVYDPLGTVAAFLRGQGTPFQALKSLANLPTTAKVLVIGRDALSSTESASSRLAAYAAGGRTVIVLEQKNPLRFQALPGEMASDTNAGDIAFAEDLDSPIFQGLKQKDFFAWGPDGRVYENAYAKPTRGGKSLLQCDWRLQDSALAQMQAGPGLMLISQLAIGEKIGTNPVAQTLLRNMIAYGLGYKLVYKPVTVAAADSPALLKSLDATGLRDKRVADPLQALALPGSVAVISASPSSLHALAANLPKTRAFTEGGGWIILNGLTPAGLADYNKLVGVAHLIRPFRQEKVAFPPTRSPLTAGLATSNIVLGSGKQIFDYAAGQYPDADAFSYVVDYDDVAPFAASSFGAFDKIVNAYTMADGFWPLIINLPALDKDGHPVQVPMTLPRPEKITQFIWVSDTNYAGTTKVGLELGGKTETFATQPNGDPQTFPVSGASPATKEIILQIADWEHDPAKQHDGQDLIGIDNIALKAYRTPEFYRKVQPLLNIGAMVAYPQGKGGIILCNVKFQDTEANPENTGKKQAIIAALLRNLQAPFTGGKTIIAGAKDLTYTPLDLSKQANQYLNAQGWFGDKAFTFADLPTGRHTFAGVPYSVYSFATSPVPTVVMLGGSNVPGGLAESVTGIPIHRKADALFFLQAARLDQRRSPDEVKNNKQYEMADYVVHYADGQTAKIPVYAEIDVDDYKQTTPTPLPGAQIAWTKPYAGTDRNAVAYEMQWNNPRPAVPIESVDLVYGPDRRGVPALLALTAASAF